MIATPGRLLDFLRYGLFNLSQVNYAVLDEGDRMLDMGFFPQIEDIFLHTDIPKESRQTTLFSATFPQEVVSICRQLLKKDAIFLSIGEVGAAAELVVQQFIQVRDSHFLH